jgi:hypothetical protein
LETVNRFDNNVNQRKTAQQLIKDDIFDHQSMRFNNKKIKTEHKKIEARTVKHPKVELPHIPLYPPINTGEHVIVYSKQIHAARFIGPLTYEDTLAHFSPSIRRRWRQYFWDHHSILEREVNKDGEVVLEQEKDKDE